MPDQVWTTGSLGLGGNVGKPQEAMAKALQGLNGRDDCRVVVVSRLYLTPPWGKTDQADFYNCCAVIETTLEPEALLSVCLKIEKEMKRVREERWGPRTLDIDILTYGDLEERTERLELPHPRMTERAFVMLPLADIAPELVVSGRKVQSWAGGVRSVGMRILSHDSRWWQAAV